MPGGFIEQRETVWQSCLRELAEETHCDVPEATLRAALQSVAVFDHPDRSQRGRTITHAHYFDLGNAPCPPCRLTTMPYRPSGSLWAKLPHWKPSSSKTTSTCLTISLQITGLVGSAG